MEERKGEVTQIWHKFLRSTCLKLSNHDELFPCSIETLSISHNILGENRITTTNHLTFLKNTVFHVYYIYMYPVHDILV